MNGNIPTGELGRRLVSALVAVLVGVALLHLPYGYYAVMRWIVCGACVWLTMSSYRIGDEGWAWVWGVLAGIYNPLMPLHANRAVWSIVNVGTVVIVLAQLARFKVSTADSPSVSR